MAVVAKIVCILVALMMVAAPATEAALSCGTVSQGLAPCLAYLKGGPGPSPACCGGVKSLAGMAQTPQDRQAVCGCLKSAVVGINLANAAGLPGKCDVSVPYTISPTTDCSQGVKRAYKGA